MATDYTADMLRRCDVDPDNGGAYKLNGRTYHLRPRITEGEIGDRGAFVEYVIARSREYSAIADAIRDHNTRAFSDHFRAALRK